MPQGLGCYLPNNDPEIDPIVEGLPKLSSDTDLEEPMVPSGQIPFWLP